MSNELLYQERFERIQKAIHLEPVDRVPVVYMGVAFAPRYMGMTIAEFCADPEAAFQVTLATMDRLGALDGANLAGGGRITALLTSIWLARLGVPGRDLPPDSLWQVREAEVMTPADYDVIIEKGWNAFLMSYLPRVIDPAEFGEAMGWQMTNAPRVQQAYREHDYVVVCDAPVSVGIPFEYLCGGRSMQKFFLDLYRTPDKVQAAMDVILAEMLGQINAAPRIPGIIGGTWLGGWRAASALVAPKLWDRFVWPYYLKLVEALVNVGITPVLHWDQNWTRDLVRLQELPAKKCILNPDGMTDVRKFKQLVGDRMAMMGDVPASLLAAGTPDDIRKYVHDLIDVFQGTGLILCPGCDAPINAKPENMEAFVAASHEYGPVAQLA
jgi:uroporphyrinogen-III decarboxylase